MSLSPSPELFRVIGGVLTFLSAVLLWSALGIEDYVTNHFLLTFTWQNNPILADQYFTVGAYHLCSSVTYYNQGSVIDQTGTSCPTIDESCSIRLQLQDSSGEDLYTAGGLPLSLRSSCATFKAGRAFLVISALLFTFVSLLMSFLPCAAFQRLLGRWSQSKVDRALVIEGAAAVVVAFISILCQPDNASDEFEEAGLCASLLASDTAFTACQTPTSTWGASFDCHAVAIVLGALGVCFYAGAWRMGLKRDLAQPLVSDDRGEIGGIPGAGHADDSENWGQLQNHTLG